MRYVLTESAKRDIREITGAIRASHPRAARQIGRDIQEGIRQIVTLPRLGGARLHPCDESLRGYHVHTYLIAYKVVEKTVEIVVIY